MPWLAHFSSSSGSTVGSLIRLTFQPENADSVQYLSPEPARRAASLAHRPGAKIRPPVSTAMSTTLYFLASAIYVSGLLQDPAGAAAARRGDAPPAAFARSVPSGELEPGVLQLSLADAVSRGLSHNLGMLLVRDAVEIQSGRRAQARSAVRPELFAALGQSRSKVNLAAFGFPPTAERPSVVGPFDVIEARLLLAWNALDRSHRLRGRAGTAALEAATWSRDDAQDLLVLAVTDSYLRTVAWRSQVEASRAQVRTATSLRSCLGDVHPGEDKDQYRGENPFHR